MTDFLKGKIIVLFWLWKKGVYLALFLSFFLKKRNFFDRYYFFFFLVIYKLDFAKEIPPPSPSYFQYAVYDGAL